MLKDVVNSHKLNENRPTDVWKGNERVKRAASQIGFKALTVNKMFDNMKNDMNKSSEFKSCVKFVRRYEVLVVTGQFEIE